MRKTDARGIVEYLAAAFPQQRLAEESLDVFESELALLFDPEIALAAAKRLVATEDRFPSIKAIRETYRAAASSVIADRARPELPPPGDPKNPAEWEQAGLAARRLRAVEFAARPDGTVSPDPSADDPPPRNQREFNREWARFMTARYGASLKEMLGDVAAATREVHGDANAVEREAYARRE